MEKTSALGSFPPNLGKPSMPTLPISSGLSHLTAGVVHCNCCDGLQRMSKNLQKSITTGEEKINRVINDLVALRTSNVEKEAVLAFLKKELATLSHPTVS